MTADTQIIAFNSAEPAHKEAFYRLNKHWIEQHFVMEAADYRALEQPEKIIENGGHILLAKQAGSICGTCALIAMADGRFELAKMAVADSHQGQGIGRRLGQAAIDYAQQQGAPGLYLESNRSLTSAINLYRALGFEEVSGVVSPYARCDIQMAVWFARTQGENAG